MSIEPTYRIDLKSQDVRDLAALVGIDQPTMFMILDELRTHWIVDTRLQAIADARSTRRGYSVEEWMDCAMLALDSATKIGMREGTHLHYGNHDVLIETGSELLAGLSLSLGSRFGSAMGTVMLRRLERGNP